MRIVACGRWLLFALIVLSMSIASFAQVGIAITIGPPALPVYEQPLCPGEGYIWTPGYWAYDYNYGDYYWVPGTWVLAPEVGFLWTPPWWGWVNGAWLWHEGYWGPHVGFYGGINYGFGYFGLGFVGGRWDHDHFFYNRAVMNVNIENVHNVYEERITNVTVNHVSYNGGPGGIEARARPEDEIAARDRHIGAVAAQTQHLQAARGNPELRASANHGKPPIAATARPGEFSGREVVQAREAGGTYNPPANRGGANRGGNVPRGESSMSRTPVHPNELPKAERITPNTGDPNRDRKFQQQQDKMFAKQEQERQKLQQQQEKEHQQAARQNANEARQQQMEQRHQQQTQQLQQKHTQQRQQLQQRYQPPAGRKK